MTQTEPPANMQCARCGAAFFCGFAAGAACCWCFDLPHTQPLPAPDAERPGCLCPRCLRAQMGLLETDEGPGADAQRG